MTPALRFILLSGLALVAAACGNQVAPTGGPKDTTPASVTKTDPPTGTLNYTKGEATFYFDEPVRPVAIGTELLISPLPRRRPKASLSDNAKKIRLKFDEVLLPQTTYVITLTGVKNYYENLPMASAYTLAFSTGTYIDSLQITGSVKDYQGEIPYGLTLLLFDADSVQGTDFFGKKPAYLTKIDSSGNFHFKYLRRTQYKLFGVKDADQSNSYNAPSEPVALPMDTLIVFSETDSLQTTTLISFLQDLRGPQVRSYAWLSEQSLLIRFSERPRLDYLEATISDTLRQDSLPLEYGHWLGGTDLEAVFHSPLPNFEPAALRLIRISDSLGNRADSLVRLLPTRTKTWKDPLLTKPVFSDKDTAFELITPRLLTADDYSLIRIMDTTGKDTTLRPLPLSVKQDGFRVLVRPQSLPAPKRKMRLEVDGRLFARADSDSVYSYSLTWPDLSDQATVSGKVRFEDSTLRGPFVVQMLSNDKQQTVVGTAYDTVFTFRYLKPGNYTFRIVIDTDSNQVWTPGQATPYRLPETILVSKGELLSVRAGWQYDDYEVLAGKKEPGQRPGPGGPPGADGSRPAPPAVVPGGGGKGNRP